MPCCASRSWTSGICSTFATSALRRAITSFGSAAGAYNPFHAALPKDVIARLNADVAKVLQIPEVQERLAQQGIDRVGNSPEQAAVYLRSEIVKWGKVIRSANLRVD